MAAIAQRLALRRAEVSLGTSAAVSLAAGLAATSTVLGALAPSEERAANALVRGLLVAAPMAAGVYAARVEQHHRLARLLYATGLVAFVTTLAETGDATLYTAGRTAGWLVQLALVVLVLSYPSGRLEARADRWIGAAMGATVALFYLPTLLVAEGFPVPSPWTSCAAACPANALFVGEHQAAWVEPLLRAPGALALFAVMLAVVVRLQQRLASATNATRRLLLPVLVVGVADAVLVGVGVMAREFGGSPRPVQVVSWTLTFALPAFSLVFAAGLLRARMFGDQALRRLAHVVQHLPAAGTLAPVLGEALEDPSVQILFPANVWETRWVDAAGAEVTLPRGDPTRGIHRVVEGDRLIAAITYDPHLVVRLQLLEAAGGLAAVALDNQRLTAQAEGLTREAERSRARIAASAAEERRRIERDLHDGAQQRLVAL